METIKWLNIWINELLPALQALYYLAAVALTVIAFKGLEQLKIAKDTARTNARREAFKLAADECRNFADRVIPLADRISDECNNKKLGSFTKPRFKIVNGEITDRSFPDDKLAQDIKQCTLILYTFLNSLEAFAIFFASGIAEESVGYRETGKAFCSITARFMPGIHFSRIAGAGRYESTVKLYELWSARSASDALAKVETSLTDSLASLQTKMKGLKKEGIKVIGDE